jgi:transposase-like protein
MYSRDTLVLLKHLLESGQPKAAIARELGISRRLVYHLIATGQVERDVARAGPPSTSTCPTRPAWVEKTAEIDSVPAKSRNANATIALAAGARTPLRRRWSDGGHAPPGRVGVPGGWCAQRA